MEVFALRASKNWVHGQAWHFTRLMVGRLDGVPPSIAAFCHAGLGAAVTCCDIVEKESLCSQDSIERHRARKMMGLANADVLPNLDRIGKSLESRGGFVAVACICVVVLFQTQLIQILEASGPPLLAVAIVFVGYLVLTGRETGAGQRPVPAGIRNEEAIRRRMMDAGKEPTVIYDIICKKSLQMRLVFLASSKLPNFDMRRDNNALEELNGMTLKVCGSGFAAFYSDTLDMGLVLAFSNPNAGSNKIGGKFLAGMPLDGMEGHGRLL